MTFIAVRSYDNYIPANIMLQRLEGEGIRAYLQDENTVTIGPILSNVVDGIKLMVYEDQLERAIELIHAFEQSYRQAAACPRCGSLQVQYIMSQPKNPSNWFSALLSWLFDSEALPDKKVYHCYDCGYEFEELPDQDSLPEP